ncbi:MAG: hypothetical protein U0271_12200 [Polyangiaceae bacterium]
MRPCGTPVRAMVLGGAFTFALALHARDASAEPAVDEPATTAEPATTDAGPPAPDPSEVARLAEIRRRSIAVRRSLNIGGLASGLISTAAGVAFMIPETPTNALRFAGLTTTIFGVIDTIVGAVALAGIERQEDEWEERRAPERTTGRGFREHVLHAMADERREALAHGINLGLAIAYAIGGGTAILASQLGVDQPQRWLASGISICGQAVMLVVLDALGTVDSSNRYNELERLATPIFTVSTGRDAGFTAGFSKQF